MQVSGAPAVASIVQELKTPVEKGDMLAVRVYHLNSNAANIRLWINDEWVRGTSKRDSAPVETVSYIFPQDMPVGTRIGVHHTIWPGEDKAWVDWIRLVKGVGMGSHAFEEAFRDGPLQPLAE